MSQNVSKASLELVKKRTQDLRHGPSYYIGWAVFFFILAWAWQGSEIRPLDLIKDSGNMRKYAADFFRQTLRIGNSIYQRC